MTVLAATAPLPLPADPPRAARSASDPDLRLLVDDRPVLPRVGEPGCYSFELAAPVGTIRLLSRAVVPARHMQGTDTRRLGVSLWWIRLHSEQVTIEVQPDHKLLLEGFHAAERAARWTDGYALVPPSFYRMLTGPFTMEVRIGTPDLTYPAEPDDARPRVLVIDETLPTPDRDAGSNVMWEHLRLLQSLGYAVTFLPANLDAPEPYAAALEAEGVELVFHPLIGGAEQFLARRGAGLAVAYLHRVEIAERMLPLLRRFAPQARVLFNPADLHFLRLQREADVLGSETLRAEAEALQSRELAIIAAADATLMCNTVEMALARQALPDAGMVYLPWVIPPRPEPRPAFAARQGIMFLGGFAHRPNADGIAWFVAAVMPKLRSLVPGIALHVYGHAIPDAVAALAADDVHIEGHAPDLAAVFARHLVSIAPLRFGAGFKGKIAESLAHGVPVVATPVAAEGTGLADGEHLIVAEDPAAFAAAVALLHLAPGMWGRLSDQGLRHVEAAFAPALGRTRLAEALALAGLPPTG